MCHTILAQRRVSEMATERIAEATGCDTEGLLQSWWLAIKVSMESRDRCGYCCRKSACTHGCSSFCRIARCGSSCSRTGLSCIVFCCRAAPRTAVVLHCCAAASRKLRGKNRSAVSTPVEDAPQAPDFGRCKSKSEMKYT